MYEIKTLSLKPLIFGKTTITKFLVILMKELFHKYTYCFRLIIT